LRANDRFAPTAAAWHFLLKPACFATRSEFLQAANAAFLQRYLLKS
jgi:hypothetical protein